MNRQMALFMSPGIFVVVLFTVAYTAESSPAVQAVSTNNDDDASPATNLRSKRQSEYATIRAEYNRNLYQGDIGTFVTFTYS